MCALGIFPTPSPPPFGYHSCVADDKITQQFVFNAELGREWPERGTIFDCCLLTFLLYVNKNLPFHLTYDKHMSDVHRIILLSYYRHLPTIFFYLMQ
jgi:hypothetical protein